ncbi:MAG: hypothetical protein ACTHW4_13615 [Actinomycetales bacterium]
MSPEEAAGHVNGAFVVVVHLFGTDRHRRRIYLTLNAAERSARRARDRGHAAHVLLARLVPVATVGPAGAPVGEVVA